MRILIADDCDLVRRGLIRLLSAETGLDATRRLRLELPEAKILLITQDDPVQLRPAIVEAGGDACLDEGRLGTDLVTTIKSLRRT